MENEFEILISQYKKSILESDYETAEKHINEAFSLNNNSPKVHNLLGIIVKSNGIGNWQYNITELLWH